MLTEKYLRNSFKLCANQRAIIRRIAWLRIELWQLKQNFCAYVEVVEPYVLNVEFHTRMTPSEDRYVNRQWSVFEWDRNMSNESSRPPIPSSIEFRARNIAKQSQ